MKIKRFIQVTLIQMSMFLMLVLPAYAIADKNTDDAIKRLVDSLEAKRLEHHIPGMAIAVVKDDQVILSQGFGVMDLEQQTPATDETLFAIGSSTKSFTAIMTAMLVDQGKLSWDDELTEYLPEYHFTVAGKTLPITLRDALSHRTGYTRNDLLWANGQASRELILKTATNALPWDDFREQFYYNNVMYLATGEALAKVADSSWDELLQKIIFQPLGMNSSTSIHEAAIANKNISLGYQWNDETESHDLLPRRNLNNIAPAGGIYSNVTDMSQWVRLLLKDGQWDDKQLVSKEQLHATWEPTIDISGNMKYGMGWFVRPWQNQTVVEHGGNIDGYGAQVALLPESNLGFVLLTNLTATPLQQESINLVWELLANTESQSNESSTEKASIDYNEFVGEYHANFASFKDSIFTFLIKENGMPAVDVPGQTVYELKDPDADGKWYFAMTDTIALSFDRDKNGDIAAMRLHQNRMDFELPKKGIEIKPEIDLSELQMYLGQYQSKAFNRPINAIIQNHRLTLDVPNQMAFELHLPDAQGYRQFRIKSDMSAQFESDETGKITHLVLYRDKEKVVDTAPRIASAQVVDLPSVDEIMALMDTKKRKKALKQKNGFALTGTIHMANSGITGTITTLFDANKKYRQHMDFGTFGEILVVANEKTAATSGINPYTEFKGKYLKQIRLDHPSVALDLRSVADKIQVIGNNELNGSKVYVIRTMVKDLPSRTYYIDAKNGDILKLKTKLLNPTTGAIPITIEYADHKNRHGLRVPMKTTIKNPMMGKAIIEYKAFKAKQKFKDSQFKINI
jgi:CubicO group peptidase (beta-lactamase class C family)